MKWGRRWLLAILVASAIFWTGCGPKPVIYRPSSDQVLLVPEGTVLRAPEGRTMTTDSGGQTVEKVETTVEFPSVLLSEGYFLTLWQASQACRAP